MHKQAYQIWFNILNNKNNYIKLTEYLYPENELILKAKGYKIEYFKWDNNHSIFTPNYIIISWPYIEKDNMFEQELKIYGSSARRFDSFKKVPEDLNSKGYPISVELYVDEDFQFKGTFQEYKKISSQFTVSILIVIYK